MKSKSRESKKIVEFDLGAIERAAVDKLVETGEETFRRYLEAEAEKRLASLRLLTVRQIREQTGWTDDRCRRLLRENEVPYIADGASAIRYRLADLEQLLDKLTLRSYPDRNKRRR